MSDIITRNERFFKFLTELSEGVASGDLEIVPKLRCDDSLSDREVQKLLQDEGPIRLEDVAADRVFLGHPKANVVADKQENRPGKNDENK